jgi:hypothetical protein
MNDNQAYPYLNFPTVIDITLYKNNYYDNLLVNKIKKEVDYGDIPDLKDCYIVQASDFQNVFYKSFSSEIEKVKALPASDLQKNATSLYFLDRIFEAFSRLKYIKINVSNEANYSRINKTEKVPTIFFNYKITASTIDVTTIFTEEEVSEINSFLIKTGIAVWDNYTGYNHIMEIKAFDLITILQENNSEPAVPLLFEIIDPKTEQDNPLLFIITDFDTSQ